MFLTPGATYTCDGTAFPGLRALLLDPVPRGGVPREGKWTDKGIF